MYTAGGHSRLSGLLPNMVLPVRLTVPISKVRYNLRYHDMVIANGRTVGDAAGSCTFFSDNGEGSSNVDLAIVSSLLYPSLALLDILPKWECSDHLPVKLGWLTNNSIPTTRAPGDHNSSKRRGLKFAEEKTDKFHAEIGNVRVNSDLTNCISSLSTGQCGVDEALHTLGKIIKNYMKRAFGISNNKTGPTGASWWNSDCENAKLKFREAHRKDTEGIQIAGALRLSAETLVLRRKIAMLRKRPNVFMTLRMLTLLLAIFSTTPGFSGGTLRIPLRSAPSVTPRDGRIISRVWLALRFPTLMVWLIMPRSIGSINCLTLSMEVSAIRIGDDMKA